MVAQICFVLTSFSRADLILEVITGDAVVRCSLSKESTRNLVSYSTYICNQKQVEQLYRSEVKAGKLVFTGPKKLKGKKLEDLVSAKACKLLPQCILQV